MLLLLHLAAVGLPLLSGSLAQTTNNATSEIVPLLRQASLIPSVIPAFNATIGPFDITYPNGIVNYGNNFSLSATKYAPNVQFSGEQAFPNALYTLAMVDPDAPTPSNPTASEIRHWLVSNITPNGQQANYSVAGTGGSTVLSSYISPAPPAGSPPHRYTLVLFRQSSQTVSLGNQTSTSNFNLITFARQNNLTPVSGNYFVASTTTGTSTGGSTTNSGAASSGSANAGANSGSSGTKSASPTGLVSSATTPASTGASTPKSTSDAEHAHMSSWLTFSSIVLAAAAGYVLNL